MKSIAICIGVLALLVTSLFVIGLRHDGTEDTPEWEIRNLRIWKGTTVWDLALSVKQQDTGKIKRLVKAHPDWLNYQEPRYGASLLIWAVGVEKYQSAEALLQCGANANLVAKNGGETALFVAAGFSWVDNQAKTDPKYVKLLLKYGADPNINFIGDKHDDFTEPGTSPLMESIGCGIEKTKALVEGGADINYETATGNTAAIVALMEVGPTSTFNAMEYAHYLIAEKRAKIKKSWRIPPDDPSDPVVIIAPVTLLRDWIYPLDSKGYKLKMDIINEFTRQGVNYWKTKIPSERLEQIKKLYPSSWQEYIKKY